MRMGKHQAVQAVVQVFDGQPMAKSEFSLVGTAASDIARWLIAQPGPAYASVFALEGLLFALSAVGVDLTALSVLGGALGVGLGFGLQKLAANYVSGFVILFERSLRIGDTVRVDSFEGEVVDIKTRYTLIRASNGRESVVPNEKLITERIENLSLADSLVLLMIDVTVGYDTDVDQVRPLLVDAALSVDRVLRDPGPAARLVRLGADAETRYTADGKPIVNFSGAYNYGRRDDDGKRPSQWVKFAWSGDRADRFAQYLRKGKRFLVLAQDVRVTTYQDREGNTRASLEAWVSDVEFADTAEDGDRDRSNAPAPRSSPAPAASSKGGARSPSKFDDLEDDIPF